jgi:histidinol phosphatase-like PHP family hydrolase
MGGGGDDRTGREMNGSPPGGMMSQGIYNLHNHTPFSDGAYTVDELCEAHLDCVALRGYEVLGIGITDHMFCTPSSREVSNEKEFERLFAKETRAYVSTVKEARQRWAGRLRVFCGAEINWPLNKGLLDSVRSLLAGIDYVLFEYVDWAGLTQLANQARRWPCPVGLAHADVAAQFPNTSMDQVVRTLANARIIYELSSKLMPLSNQERWFRVVPNHRVQVAIGTDTHDDLGCLRDLPSLHAYALQHGLGEKLFVPSVRSEEPVPVSQ